MSKIKVPLTEANPDQLRKFAAEHLQLDGVESLDDAGVLGAIGTAWTADYILADEPEEAFGQSQSAERPATALGKPQDGEPTYVVRIGETEMPGGKEPATPGVNGRVLVIQRGREVKIPASYFDVLHNAKRGITRQDPKTGAISTSEVTNFPMEVLQRPSPEELEAWKARKLQAAA